MKAAAFDYLRADSTATAITALHDGRDHGFVKLCGGSQSLGPMLNLRLAQPTTLIDISRLDALRGFELQGDMLRIGAAVTHARIEDGELPDVTRGLLPSVASNIAYRAVRNRGTIGGSLAHADPAADWVSTMCLLDAAIVIAGPGGERHEAASAFFIGPFTTTLEDDELIAAVEVPVFSADARWAYRKLCRKPGEFADALGAAWVEPGRGIARALIGALDGPPHVVDGVDAVAALATPEGMADALDAAGLDDEDARDLQAVMLRRALNDLKAFA